jgi:hypothetical protein
MPACPAHGRDRGRQTGSVGLISWPMTPLLHHSITPLLHYSIIFIVTLVVSLGLRRESTSFVYPDQKQRLLPS